MTYHLHKTELIGLEAIQDLIELVLWTLFVRGERIVSLLIVAEPESGKTELMKKYCRNMGIHVRRRFTACGILKDLRGGKISMLFSSHNQQVNADITNWKEQFHIFELV